MRSLAVYAVCFIGFIVILILKVAIVEAATNAFPVFCFLLVIGAVIAACAAPGIKALWRKRHPVSPAEYIKEKEVERVEKRLPPPKRKNEFEGSASSLDLKSYLLKSEAPEVPVEREKRPVSWSDWDPPPSSKNEGAKSGTYSKGSLGVAILFFGFGVLMLVVAGVLIDDFKTRNDDSAAVLLIVATAVGAPLMVMGMTGIYNWVSGKGK